MKKIIILSTLLFQLSFAFGQTSEWSEWGGWTNCNCYSKLMFRLKSASSPKYNESNFMIEFKSNYPQTVTFGWDGFNNQSEANNYFSKGAHGTQSDISINPGKSTTLSFDNKGAGSKIAYIVVYRLSIGKDYQHYQKCDNQKPCSYCELNKDPYCPNYASSNQTNNSNQQTTQQNNLSEYNRSKADLERQIAEKNAEGQQKSQNYTTAMNAGISAHNSGNYAEAKNQFSIALNNCNTEEARQKAQEYYNKSVDAVKSQAKNKVIGEIVQGGVQILGELQKAQDNKMQKLNAELDESKRKQAIIDEDKAINTLTDSKIFETFVNYAAKNVEELNLKFEKIKYYLNIPSKEKTVGLDFEGCEVTITNRWDGSSMSKYLTFKFDSKNTFDNIINKPFFENLKSLYPFYDNFSAKLNSFEHSNFIVFGLEKTQSFLDVYKNGYKSDLYKGFFSQLNEFENIAKQKLNNTDSSTKGFIEKAELYKSGLGGVEKNYEKALELYQQTYDKGKDKEILLKIGQLHQENKNYAKAITHFENYINNNENIKPIVYSNLAWIYKEDSSPFYDLEKAKSNFEKKIKILEENNLNENDEIKKIRIKKEIAFTYSVMGFMYNYYGKNVTPETSVPYYEKTMLWNEDDYSSAFELMRLYAKDWKAGNFQRDAKKAKFWALKVCEISKRLEEKNNGSHEAKMAKMNCTTANEHINSNFKYLKK